MAEDLSFARKTAVIVGVEPHWREAAHMFTEKKLDLKQTQREPELRKKQGHTEYEQTYYPTLAEFAVASFLQIGPPNLVAKLGGDGGVDLTIFTHDMFPDITIDVKTRMEAGATDMWHYRDKRAIKADLLVLTNTPKTPQRRQDGTIVKRGWPEEVEPYGDIVTILGWITRERYYRDAEVILPGKDPHYRLRLAADYLSQPDELEFLASRTSVT